MTQKKRSVPTYREYFTRKFSRYGDRVEALDYGRVESQRRKFEVLAQGIRATNILSLLDIGCGFGDFLGFLKERGTAVGRYLGIDLLPEMVKTARKRHPEGRFEARDILRDGLRGRYDYVVANGIFYLRAADSEEHLRRMVRLMWVQCRRGLLFNARSQWADPEFVRRERHLYEYDPTDVLRFCMSLTRAIILRHDYMPHEFTIYMYREGQ